MAFAQLDRLVERRPRASASRPGRTPPRTAPCRPAPGSRSRSAGSRRRRSSRRPSAPRPCDSLDPLEDALALALADHGPDVRVARRPGRRPAAPRPSGTNSATNASQALVDDEDPLHRDAALARERERVRGELRRGAVGASAQTIAGVALPSSSLTRLRCARSARPQPTSPEPVNVISFTRSSSTSTSPISDAAARRRR